MVKVSAYNVGEPGSIPGLGRSPGEENGNPLLYSCLENPMDGQRSLVGYSPRGHKESDTTERLHFHFEVTKEKILLPAEKGMKQSLFLKLPLSSRKWPGSNISGLGNTLSSYSTELSDTNTPVPWEEKMKIN